MPGNSEILPVLQSVTEQHHPSELTLEIDLENEKKQALFSILLNSIHEAYSLIVDSPST